MSESRRKEIENLALKTLNRNIIFIYDGDFSTDEISYFLQIRAKANKPYITMSV